MKRLVYVLLAVALSWGGLLLGGCGESPRRAALLGRADSLMASRPDAALALLDSLLADSGHLSAHFAMQCRLRRLNAINKLDTVFTPAHVALAQTLTEHFDEHGTPNERMLAHYLLGRTFADTGEAPQAIAAYSAAAEHADTLSADCDYRTLSRVYAQMAEVFFVQNLLYDELKSNDNAVRYAYLAKDTLGALVSYMQKMETYKRLMKPDSMLYVCENVSGQLNRLGYPSLAASVLYFPVRYLVDQGEFAKAKSFMEVFEHASGCFDKNQNINPGREIYYFTKGYYYLKTCQFDSAEYYFRKELATGNDFNNQNAGARGLALLFQQTHYPDSAAKYALYSYAMNDSGYAQIATDEVAKSKALYDYTRYEHEAHQSKLDAMRSQLRFIVTAFIALLVLAMTVVLAYRYHSIQKQRKKEKEYYQHLLDAHCRTMDELRELRVYQEQFSKMSVEWRESMAHQQRTEQELNRLRSSEQMLQELIRKKQQELASLDAELTQYRRKDEMMAAALSDEEHVLRVMPFYLSLLRTTDNGLSLADNDWEAIQVYVKGYLPHFAKFLTDNRPVLTDYEYKMCLLVRLHFKPKNIANALGLDASYVTRVRRSMVRKLFGVEVSSKEADILVRQIDRIKPVEPID